MSVKKYSKRHLRRMVTNILNAESNSLNAEKTSLSASATDANIENNKKVTLLGEDQKEVREAVIDNSSATSKPSTSTFVSDRIDGMESLGKTISDTSLSSASFSSSDTENDDYDKYNKLENFCNVKNVNTELLHRQLKEWAIKYNVNKNTINGLLKILNLHHPDLPRDTRTLLRTPRSGTCLIKEVDPGSYHHFGLKSSIQYLFEKHCSDAFNGPILFNISVDGLPISKSSNSQFWPILINISNISFLKEPVIVGLYHGLKKPNDANDFLKDLVDEYNSIKDGISFFIKNAICITIDSLIVNCIIADAPAKSFLLNIKGHTGYSSCTKCVIEGDNYKDRIVFVKSDAKLRTSSDFFNRVDEDFHHPGPPSIILELLQNPVQQVVLDYMHLVCIGVVKRILKFFVHGNASIRLKPLQLQAISNKINLFRQYTPVEFARLGRKIEDVDRWKATECRHFILYSGPSIMRQFLSKTQFVHFMSLHTAMRILCSPTDYNTLNEYANSLMIYFVEKYEQIYGREFVTHNVHNLIHLAADSANYGPLDNFSAFPFENYLHKIKSFVRSARFPLEQMYNKIMEERVNIKSDQIEDSVQLKGLYYLNKNKATEFYTTLIGTFFTIKVGSEGDNCFATKDNKILSVNTIFKNTKDNDIYLEVNYFENNGEDITYPCNSTIIKIFIVSNLSDKKCVISYSDLIYKCLKFPLNDGKDNSFKIMPLLHSVQN